MSERQAQGNRLWRFCLSGLLEPDSGAVEYSGKQLSDYSIKEIRGKDWNHLAASRPGHDRPNGER